MNSFGKGFECMKFAIGDAKLLEGFIKIENPDHYGWFRVLVKNYQDDALWILGCIINDEIGDEALVLRQIQLSSLVTVDTAFTCDENQYVNDDDELDDDLERMKAEIEMETAAAKYYGYDEEEWDDDDDEEEWDDDEEEEEW